MGPPVETPAGAPTRTTVRTPVRTAASRILCGTRAITDAGLICSWSLRPGVIVFRRSLGCEVCRMLESRCRPSVLTPADHVEQPVGEDDDAHPGQSQQPCRH